MQTLEQRRATEKERHRQSMARKRAHEKATLNAQREECAALIAQQQALLGLSWYQRECDKWELWGVLGGTRDTNDKLESATRAASFHDKYTDLVELGNAVHRENAELQRMLHKYEMFESLLDGDLTDVVADQLKVQQSEAHLSSSDRWVQFTEDEEPFYYDAVDATACHEAVGECYPLCVTHHARFMQLDSSLEQPQRFLGWSVQRLADRAGNHHFHYSKRILCGDAASMTEFIADEAWHVFNTRELYERLYSARVVMHVLQRVDEHTVVALQSLPVPDNSVNRRCLTLASKISTADEAGRLAVNILMLGIKPPGDLAQQQRGPDVQFVQNSNAYLVLQQRADEAGGDDFVEMSLGIHRVFASDAEARFAFLEYACALVRFEQLVLPQKLVDG
ncbi:uncharacterized protein IUM83_14870 [Phytophthora cinnamomi]|uniref:uncharacterized protein n=1 Tax=Phytophthora cinnamomi TaxID=4785 RepID=UPI00355A2DE2|nr:hypothetical protein IUM83_14870 [Phytophthora cinnamomi]